MSEKRELQTNQFMSAASPFSEITALSFQIPAQNGQQQNQQKNHQSEAHEHMHDHDQLDDNCEGCRREKYQNQKLVDFYQRLEKMKATVQKRKEKHNQNSHSTQNQSFERIQQKMAELTRRVSHSDALPSVQAIKQYDSKEIGFQLAAALLEREARFKSQNLKLQEKINQLLEEKKSSDRAKNNAIRLSEQRVFGSSNEAISKEQSDLKGNKIGDNSPGDFWRFGEASSSKQFPSPKQSSSFESSNLKDSLDMYQGKKGSSQRDELSSSYWEGQVSTPTGQSVHKSNRYSKKHTALMDADETTFFRTKKNESFDRSFFAQNQNHNSAENDSSSLIATKSRSQVKNAKQYGLNLWLYEFQPEEYDQNFMQSLNGNYSNGNRSPKKADFSARSGLRKSDLARKDLKQSPKIAKVGPHKSFNQN